MSEQQTENTINNSNDNCVTFEEIEKYHKEQIAISEGKDPESIAIFENIYRNANLGSEEQYEKLFGKVVDDENTNT